MQLSFRDYLKHWGLIYVLSAAVLWLSFRLQLPKHGPMSSALMLFLIIDLFWFYRLSQTKALSPKQRFAPLWHVIARIPLISVVLFCTSNLILNLAFWTPFWRTYGFGCMLIFVAIVCVWGLIWMGEISLNAWKKYRDRKHKNTRYIHLLSKTLFHSAWIISFIMLIAMLVGTFRTTFKLETHHYSVILNNQGQSTLRIAQFSDLHIGSQTNGSFIENMVDSIQSLNADLIVFTGDMINFRPEELLPFIHSLSRLNAPLGIFYVDGNHDYGTYLNTIDGINATQRKSHFDSLMASLGWHHLQNNFCKLPFNNDTIYLAGVGFWGRHSKGKIYSNGDQAFKDIPTEAHAIALVHNPEYFEDSVSVNYKHIDLCLSGHTHGAQMGLRYENFRISPIGLQKQYWGGLYKIESQYLIVNTGTGFNALPFRLGLRPEISCIDITL